jgi:putative transposase
VWAYCLMPNHVHLVLTPHTADGLARAIGETHRQYTGFINARSRWTGHLFQGRFSSVALDEAHLMAAARYVALNPVRARLVAQAQDWAWSSARAHLAGEDDGLVRVAPLLDRVGRFADLIDGEPDYSLFTALRDAEGTGRPLGSDEFLAALERLTGRRLQRRQPGRKPSAAEAEQLELGIGKWVRCHGNSPGSFLSAFDLNSPK